MLALSFRQRILATLVLAAGAAASVATSQIGWDLSADPAPLPPAQLDASTPEAGFAIRADLRGPLSEPSGSLSIQIIPSVTPVAGAAAPTVRVALIDGRTAELVSEQLVTIDPALPTEIGVWTNAFDACDGPCIEVYELWITRTDTDSGLPISPVSFSGTVTMTVSEYGESSDPPAGTDLLVSVEAIELTP